QNDIRSLIVKGGSGGNTLTINGTVNNAIAPLTSLFTGNGADTVTVKGTGGPLIIEGHRGAGSVTTGSTSGVQNVKGTVRVNNASGSSQLFVNNSSDFAQHVVTLNTGVGGDNRVVGKITNLAPGEISYDAARISDLRVNGGGGGSTFNVLDTVSNSLGLITRLDVGNGSDIVNVRRTTGRIDINGAGGSDTVNLGSTDNKVSALLGPVIVGQSTGSLVININDQGGTSGGRNVTLATRDVLGTRTGDIFGLIGTGFSYFGLISAVNINANPLGNTY